ncbi:unnamed protein product [Protopolystoma xenopodis]|uniref:Uncharacterized protein n=1 Tax=Protopolystoma xenopodis TaxID=117903 RepID=A0A3S5CEL9_9PLAT|nr:unnamed protein product [Protopolystoma xenopodis]
MCTNLMTLHARCIKLGGLIEWRVADLQICPLSPTAFVENASSPFVLAGYAHSTAQPLCHTLPVARDLAAQIAEIGLTGGNRVGRSGCRLSPSSAPGVNQPNPSIVAAWPIAIPSSLSPPWGLGLTMGPGIKFPTRRCLFVCLDCLDLSTFDLISCSQQKDAALVGWQPTHQNRKNLNRAELKTIVQECGCPTGYRQLGQNGATEKTFSPN